MDLGDSPLAQKGFTQSGAPPRLALHVMQKREIDAEIARLEASFAKAGAGYGSTGCEGAVSCQFCERSVDCTRCTRCSGCDGCVDCTNCQDCVACRGCTQCQACRSCERSAYLQRCFACVDCTYCFGCVGLAGKEFHIFNVPCTRKEYFARLKELSVR